MDGMRGTSQTSDHEFTQRRVMSLINEQMKELNCILGSDTGDIFYLCQITISFFLLVKISGGEWAFIYCISKISIINLLVYFLLYSSYHNDATHDI